jgi:hypothetical protein
MLSAGALRPSGSLFDAVYERGLFSIDSHPPEKLCKAPSTVVSVWFFLLALYSGLADLVFVESSATQYRCVRKYKGVSFFN